MTPIPGRGNEGVRQLPPYEKSWRRGGVAPERKLVLNQELS
jgi:hypothetical protein